MARNLNPGLNFGPAVADARAAGLPVVALESTLVTHGLPAPVNLDTALQAEAAVRAAGAVPATVAVWRGVPTVGLTEDQLRELAADRAARKASRRDLGPAVALGWTAGTTVAATMALAHRAGIRVFATGGTGGAHAEDEPFDISADLGELARTPVLVVSAGAKSILNRPRTLEILETLGVPVLGYRTDDFPAFTVGDPPPLPVSCRVESPAEAAAAFACHVALGGAGALLAQPCPPELAVRAAEYEAWRRDAARAARAAGVSGPGVTPFLLKEIAASGGRRVLDANRGLIVANAGLAGRVAVELKQVKMSEGEPPHPV